MAPVSRARVSPSRPEPLEEWPWLEWPPLLASRRREACLNGHVVRPHAAPACIPLLAGHRHGGLSALRVHLSLPCSGWMPNQQRRCGWAQQPS